MNNWKEPGRMILMSILAVAGLSCSRDGRVLGPGSDDPPLAGTELDFVEQPAFTFLLYRTDADGVESLRWSGTSQGPSADSPEATAVPFVGYGQPFRFAWRIEAHGDRVYGHYFKPVDEFLNWAPSLGPSSSVVRGFDFENSTPLEELSIYGCGEDLDCLSLLYLEETEYLLQVGATSPLGGILAVSEGRLPFRVGFPPETEYVQEDSPLQFWTAEGEGPFAFAEGDTVPAGARLSIRTRARPAPQKASDPDSLCCNQDPPGLAGATVRSFLQFGSNRDSTWLWFSIEAFSDSSHSRVEFEVGPYDHRLKSMAIDGKSVTDATPLDLTFHGGYPPRVTSVYPGEGAQIVLRNPGEGQPWPENEVPYQFSEPLTRYWDGHRWHDEDPGDATQHLVRCFYFPLRLQGAGHPEEPSTTARSFAFHWTTNSGAGGVVESPLESSDQNADEYHTATAENTFELDGEVRIRIIVPEILWLFPQLFQPGSGSSTFLTIGEYLRQSLGDVSVFARCRTTAEGDTHQMPARLDGDSPPMRSFETGPYGRQSEVARVDLSVRLGLDPQGATGEIQEYFPPKTRR